MTLSGLTHTCQAGETFDSIALDEYEDEKYACELLNANPAYSHIPIFSGGEVLQLPVVEVVEDEDEDIDPDADEESIMPVTPPWKE